MRTLKKKGRVEATTDATPEQVWAVVADVTRIGEWSHECRTGAWLDGSTTAHPGARFSGANRVGKVKWSRVNEIVSADAPDELVWRTVPTRWFPDSTEWRIRLEPDGDRDPDRPDLRSPEAQPRDGPPHLPRHTGAPRPPSRPRRRPPTPRPSVHLGRRTFWKPLEEGWALTQPSSNPSGFGLRRSGTSVGTGGHQTLRATRPR